MPGMKSVVGMGGSGNARELAEMLRQMGRGRDTILAHITPEEAQMLIDMGGSGEINPNTGLPEFQEADIQGNENFYGEPIPQDVEAQPGGFYGQTNFATYSPYDNRTMLYREGIDNAQRGPDGTYNDFYGRALRGTITPSPSGPVFNAPFFSTDAEAQQGGFYGGRAPTAEEYGAVYPEEQPGMLARGAQAVEDVASQARQLAREYPTVARLLSTGATTLPSLIAAVRARRDAQKSADELRRLGAPLRQQGEALRQQALAGNLTPQQAAAQEASRARLRQQASSRGATTGTQQAMIEGQLARSRSEQSQTNLNNAVKLLNLANAYDEEAIRTSLAANQRINDRLANVFANLGQAAAASTAPNAPEQQRPPVTQRPQLA